jgi:hypothetical protein
MAWHVSNGVRYYYRSVREGRRVRRVYAGTGLRGELAAAADAARRAQRQADACAWEVLRARLRAADAVVAGLARAAETAAHAHLLRGGFRRHARGHWRRRRGAR